MEDLEPRRARPWDSISLMRHAISILQPPKNHEKAFSPRMVAEKSTQSWSHKQLVKHNVG